MVKRSKRLEKGIESLKKEIGEHFDKLEKDISEGDEILVKYHAKEIDKSLIVALERKINLVGEDIDHNALIKKYRDILKEYKKKLGI